MLSPRKAHVLEKLADAGERGCADSSFVARFTPELLALVGGEFATVERETKKVRGRPLESVRIRLTNKGRKLIENQAGAGRSDLMHLARSPQTVAA